MCVIKLAYCVHCQRLIHIPKYKPSCSLPAITIVDDRRCRNHYCLYNNHPFPWLIAPPLAGSEGPCGAPGCIDAICRVVRIYRACDQIEECDWNNFALRKRNYVV